MSVFEVFRDLVSNFAFYVFLIFVKHLSPPAESFDLKWRAFSPHSANDLKLHVLGDIYWLIKP